MRNLWVLTLAVFWMLPLSARSASLDEIATFAEQICRKVELQGNITRKEIEVALKGDVTGLAKLIGGTVGANGKIYVNGKEYTGLPYGQLAAQYEGERECRLELAKLLLKEREKLESAVKPMDKKLSDRVGLSNHGGGVRAGHEYDLDSKAGTLRFRVNAENSCVTNEHTAYGILKIIADGKQIYTNSLSTPKMDPKGIGGGNKKQHAEKVFLLPEDVRMAIYSAENVTVSVTVDGNDDTCAF